MAHIQAQLPNTAPIYLDPRKLPSGNKRDLGHAGLKLPSPDEVVLNAERDGIDITQTARLNPVRFPALGLVVKWGEDVTIAEGQCLWFLRKYLAGSVPVPTIYRWRKQGNQTFLYMELIKGEPMDELWDDLSEDDRLSICQQLRNMIQSWRRIKLSDPRPGFLQQLLTTASSVLCCVPRSRSTSNSPLAAIDGQGLKDVMFQNARNYLAGPFNKICDFHDAFANLLLRSNTDPTFANPRMRLQESKGLQDDVSVVFTHADLDFSNILISDHHDGPVRITAIIDWHQSGRYSEPWEWLKSQTVAGCHSEWAKSYLDKIMEPAPYEYYYAWEYTSMSTI